MQPITPEQHAARMRALATHPAIRPLADQPRWTICDADKRPIDFFILKTRGDIVGCSRMQAGATTTLHELLDLVPAPIGASFFLDSAIDDVCVLDIEPECDEKLKNELASTPALYTERSLSGQGYHLLLPYPESLFDSYPEAATKKVLKCGSEHWEVLFEHWVTFTAVATAPPLAPNDGVPFADKLEQLAQTTRDTTLREVEIEQVDTKDIDYAEDLLRMVCENFDTSYGKKLADFDADPSRFEFSIISTIVNRLLAAERHILTHIDSRASWSDSETAYIAYVAATELIPHRDKHDQLREGLPWLLYTVYRKLAMVDMTPPELA